MATSKYFYYIQIRYKNTEYNYKTVLIPITEDVFEQFDLTQYSDFVSFTSYDDTKHNYHRDRVVYCNPIKSLEPNPFDPRLPENQEDDE